MTGRQPPRSPTPLPGSGLASPAFSPSGSASDLPAAIVVPSRPSAPILPVSEPVGHLLARLALWLVIIAPAVYQIGLLLEAIAGRVGYPYDLEWMEGGLLHHAERIRHGDGIYVPPNVDFIPYLYTPLYPTLLAVLGKPLGISYVVGRAVSVIGLAGIGVTTFVTFIRARQRHLAVAAASVLSLGLFAACYPYVEGWYDLVRADTLFLFMITAGIAGLPMWARSDRGIVGHGKVAAGAALMALAFFCKQTGIFYVAFGGLIVVVTGWRRTPIYVAMAAVVGLGGCWLLNRTTGGWFWIYVSEIHRAHDFNMDRFYRSFTNILWHFPAATIVIAATWLLLAATVRRAHGIPTPARQFVLWSGAYALSTVVGAIGWGTEFAHFNAYIPALLHGAIAAGAAVPAVIACVRIWMADRPRGERVTTLCAVLAAAPLAVTCALVRWSPARFTPTDADVAAGDRLIERLRGIDGDVWMPSHPWYLHLAGTPKLPHVHRMGIKDVTTRQSRTIAGLDDALRGHRFAAIVLDNHDLQTELPLLGQTYRLALTLPANERPRVFTGAQVVPDAIWVPALATTPPPGAVRVFDFEPPAWPADWQAENGAWGTGPANMALPGQALVLGVTGQRFATSMHDSDAATGRLTTAEFALDGGKLSLRLGGGDYSSDLRVELWVDGELVRKAYPPSPPTESLRTVEIELGELRGKRGKLVLIDYSTKGHLNVDDVWLWP